jgi:hypothetical protein
MNVSKAHKPVMHKTAHCIGFQLILFPAPDWMKDAPDEK